MASIRNGPLRILSRSIPPNNNPSWPLRPFPVRSAPPLIKPFCLSLRTIQPLGPNARIAFPALCARFMATSGAARHSSVRHVAKKGKRKDVPPDNKKAEVLQNSNSIDSLMPYYPRDNEVLLKKVEHLQKNRNPITASHMLSLIRKAKRKDNALTDRILSLLPQLSFESLDVRAKERKEQEKKVQKELKKHSGQSKQDLPKRPAKLSDEELTLLEDQDEMKKFTSLLGELAKLNRVEAVLYVFQMLRSRENEDSAYKLDTYIYNIVINSCAKRNFKEKALDLFHEMKEKQVGMDNITYTIVSNIYEAKGDFVQAEKMLEEMKAKGMKMDLVGYNNLLRFCSKRDQDVDKALAIFKEMRGEGLKPDEVTFTTLFELSAKSVLKIRRMNSLVGEPSTSEGVKAGNILDQLPMNKQEQAAYPVLTERKRQMESLMKQMHAEGIQLTSNLVNSIIHCYGALGNLREMWQITQYMKDKENVKLDESNFSWLIYYCGQERVMDRQILGEIFDRMKKLHVKSTERSIDFAVNSFAYSGRIEEILFSPTGNVWQLIKRHGVQISEGMLFNMLKIYATSSNQSNNKLYQSSESGDGGDEEEEEETERSKITTTTTTINSLKLAKLVTRMREEGLSPSLPLSNSLVKFYGHFGQIKNMWSAYDEMKRTNVKPTLSTFKNMTKHLIELEERLDKGRSVINENEESSSEAGAIHSHQADNDGDDVHQEEEVGEETEEVEEEHRNRGDLSYLLFNEMRTCGVQPTLKVFNDLIKLHGHEEKRKRAAAAAAATSRQRLQEGRDGDEDEQMLFDRMRGILLEMKREGIRPNVQTMKNISWACDEACRASLKQRILAEIPSIFE